MKFRQDHLLVVDDDENNRDMLSRRLERKGFHVTAAPDGYEALRLIQENQFDAVLLDHTMPGISGMELLETLRRNFSASQLPIIMVTAENQSESIVKALSLGASDYVSKPIDFPVALARIQTQLRQKHAEEALRESEERYALAAQAANDALWDWDLKTDEVYYSPRWKEMLGLESSEIGNSLKEWFDRVHRDDIQRLKKEMAAHREGSTAHLEIEHRMLHRNGTYRWMLARGLAVREANGQVSRMAGSLSDITDAKVGDALTGLPNRLLFLDRLERVMERAKRNKDYLFAVLFLDLDRFKLVNDSLGHTVGDQLLIAFAHRLQGGLRASDTLARYQGESTIARLGGDEFAILLDGLRHGSDAIRVSQRILESLKTPFQVGDRPVYTTASIGIALSATGYESSQDFLRDADTAMYRAKALGGARLEIFDTTMRAQTLARLQLETDLQAAVEREEFRIGYQPIVSLATGRTVGFEALLRWRHPRRPSISPAEFIPVAEETGLIVSLGKWVLAEACRQMAAWQVQFPADPPLYISVNISSRQFLESDLVDQIAQILRDSALAGKSLRLEITESAILDNSDAVRSTLLKLRELSVTLCIDDFGTGYSSLSYLQRFPIGTLKIDRSFVSNLGTNDENLQIVRAILHIAHALRMDVIAEGIETAQQFDQLERLGCEHGQGYFFAKALDVHSAEHYLRAERARVETEPGFGCDLAQAPLWPKQPGRN